MTLPSRQCFHWIVASVAALWACGSEPLSKKAPDAQVGGGTVDRDAGDAPTVDLAGPAEDAPAPDTDDGGSAVVGTLDVASALETAVGAQDGATLDGSEAIGPGGDSSNACSTTLFLPPDSQVPSMCPGVEIKSLTITFAPNDSRWSSLYDECLDQYPLYSPRSFPDACRSLCGALSDTNSTLKYSQGIAYCSLDCSSPGNPTITVYYSDTICEIPPLDSGTAPYGRG